MRRGSRGSRPQRNASKALGGMRVPWESCGGGGGKGGGRKGRVSTKLDQAENGVKREGAPGPQSRPWRLSPLPPRLFTYEVAHGGRIGIPVTLPKRHSSPTEPGPGNPPPPLSCSRLHPLGAPGSSSSSASRARRRLRDLPCRCGAPGTLRGARGRGHWAPAHLPRASRDQRGGGAASSRWRGRAVAAAWSPREDSRDTDKRPRWACSP